MIEGKEILKSERIKAKQIIKQLEDELYVLAENNIAKKLIEVPDENAYTIEYRKKLYKELEEERLKQDEEKNKNKNDDWKKGNDYDSIKLSIYKDDGEIRICNQGRYQFFIDENVKTGIVTFELATPKHLDTFQIVVDLNPKYIRVEVKEKVTQWRLDNNIYTENALIQRSQTTGHLLIKAFMISKGELINNNIDIKKLTHSDLLKKDSTKLKDFISEYKTKEIKDKQEKNNSTKKTVYYNKNESSDLKPINSLNINNWEKKANQEPVKQLIQYNNNIVNNNNKITTVKEIDSVINPKEKSNQPSMEEICKDVNLEEIPELD